MRIKQWAKLACCTLLISLLSMGLVSCGSGKETPKPEETEAVSAPKAVLTEVAPPAIFEELRQTIDNYQPQVSIISPQNGEVIADTRVSIQVDVKDYPLFKNEELGMGPHLHVILDNQPYRAVYSADDPIVFEDLSPGTHTIRMFASRPWHESFKNEGAYAQVTFHLFTETGENAPDLEQPLLTYSRPKGTYGAEPVLLDYYLTNAPIRLGEEESGAINPASQRDWRVRATINGESFIMDNWLPVYLEGFQVGQNWIKLELLDGDGNLIENAFNTAARLFTYQPEGEDTLSKLVRGELTAEEARVIVDADYQVPEPEVEEEEVVPEETEEGEETAPEAATEEETLEEETPPEPEAVTEEQAPEATTTEEETLEEETPPEPETVTEEQAPEATTTEEETLEEETPTEPETVTEEQAPETPSETKEGETSPEPETVTEENKTESETVPQQRTVEEPEAVTESKEEVNAESTVMEDTDQETNSTSETKEAETASEGDETVVEEKKIIGQ
ncbi:MAG: hypothetical protein GVY17_12160 [Cyanobacteria bacterium]|nr:hypothetical protein [Cyanobacteria bacterium GSL.Bin21]